MIKMGLPLQASLIHLSSSFSLITQKSPKPDMLSPMKSHSLLNIGSIENTVIIGTLGINVKITIDRLVTFADSRKMISE